MRVFVTGASGHIASAVIPELVAAGHEVTGLARSDAAATAVAALGATVRRGDLDDLANLQEAAAESDGVIHLAFKHEQMRSGAFQAAVAAELAVTDALGRALAGSGKPLVIASGTLGVAALGRPATEADPGQGGGRMDAESAVLALAGQGVRSSVVRIAPVTHGPLDGHGFAHVLIGIARQSGVAGYPGDGTSRWPAGHTLDVGHCFCLALEKAPAGTRWHPAGDEGIPQRQIAESIGRHLDLPAESIPADKVAAHFSFLGGFIGLDNPVSTAVTREVLGWEPVHPGLLEDFDNGTYFPE
jgi:nucleoside-diphosphate-sugar epimerase